LALSRARSLALSVGLVAGLTLVGTATAPVLGHSQLVTSVPAAGEVVPAPPTEIRLVFSEPLEAAHTGLDLLDANGATLARAIGTPDPQDPYALVAPTDTLSDGLYTVQWQALSAADGHTTSGSYTFGVGAVEPPPASGASGTTGSVHAGHDEVTTLLETESRVVGYVGLLLAFGLPVIGWLVLRQPRSAGLAAFVAACLGLAALGAVGLIVLGGAAIGSNPVAYVADSRTGQLLGARAAIALGAVLLLLALRQRRPGTAIVVAALAGLASLVLLAVSGHAAAYDSPAPAAAIVVHLVAAAVWLAGILALAWVGIVGTSTEQPLRVLVPRFSGLALVAGGLIALTGAYSDWIQTRTLVSLESPYTTTLALKIALAGGAFSIGALNYLSGGRERDGGFRHRVLLESGLAVAVLVATAVLASGSPPGQARPVAIAPVAPAVATTAPPTLELAPGRPGPTRFVVNFPAPQEHVVELQLLRLDAVGESRIELRGVAEGSYEAAGGLLPSDSRWDASVVVRDHGGQELSRTRYAFALDEQGVSEGRATPPLDPAIVVAVLLFVGAAVGSAFVLGGGTLPRTDVATSRAAVLAGSAAGAVLAALVLFAGPRL
jgi:methionine-rich copper-binding protein CopC/putative copper export protein